VRIRVGVSSVGIVQSPTNGVGTSTPRETHSTTSVFAKTAINGFR